MSLINILQNVRAASIVNDVKESDNVAEAIRQVIKSNAQKQLYAEPAIRKQSLRDIKAIYNEIVAGNIDVGNKTSFFAAKLKRIIAETERANAKNGAGGNIPKPASSIGGGIKETITAQIPSKDQMIGAASVANPVMGFGIRFMKDLISGQKERKVMIATQQKEALEALQRESEDVDDDVKPSSDALSGVVDLGETDSEMLKKIQDETIIQTDLLGDIFKIWEGSENARIEQARQDSLMRLNQLEKDREAANRVDDTGTDIVIPEAKEEETRWFAGIFDSFQGFLAPLLGLLKPLLGMLARVPVIAGALTLLSVGSKIMDDWGNAAQILGKSEESLTAVDYGAVALGSIAGWFGGIIDSILGFFGVNTDFEKLFSEKTRSFFLDIGNTFTSWIDDIKNSIVGAFEYTKNIFKEKIKGFIPFSGRESDDDGSLTNKVSDAWDSFWGNDDEKKTPKNVESFHRKDDDYIPTPEEFGLQSSGAERVQGMKKYGVESSKAQTNIVAPSNTQVDASTNQVINNIPERRERDTTLDWINRKNFMSVP